MVREKEGVARPVRSGKWFVVDESYLADLEKQYGLNLQERCDIHAEFLRGHPNGGGEATAGLVAVRLSNTQIKMLRKSLRITSYRWDGIEENAEGVAIPANYLSFLDHIREHKLVLWMDWMANVGVNVPVPEVIGYMGSLYADNIVLLDYCLITTRLLDYYLIIR